MRHGRNFTTRTIKNRPLGLSGARMYSAAAAFLVLLRNKFRAPASASCAQEKCSPCEAPAARGLPKPKAALVAPDLRAGIDMHGADPFPAHRAIQQSHVSASGPKVRRGPVIGIRVIIEIVFVRDAIAA